MSAGTPVEKKAAADATQDSLSDARATSTRDAAKWLIGSAAAIGVSMLAGSQLSSIGELPLLSARFALAVVGAALALACVATIILKATELLAPVSLTESELEAQWESPTRDWKPVVTFLRSNARYLQGAPTFPALMAERRLRADAYAADGSKVQRESLAEVDTAIRVVLVIARDRRLQSLFSGLVRRVVLLAGGAAVGITVFAWAANPGDAAAPSLVEVGLVGADLKGADLSGVDLTGADLTDADLTGADLSDAITTGVTWTGATCPDGTAADDAGGTCRGHL